MQQANQTTARTFLREKYLERKSRNSSYSTRAFARDLGMSVAYLSLVLSGKRKLSLKQAMKIVASLNMDSNAGDRFIEAVMESKRPERKSKISVVDLEVDRFRIISQWYHLPILDLVSTRGFRPDMGWIGRRLNISPIEARDAVERLERLGLLEIKSGEWRKTEAMIFFPTQKTDASVRAFHKQMIEKAAGELANTADEDFRRRNITAWTVASNPDRISYAKTMIERFQKELAEYLVSGPCTEVYQLNVQLFPLTKELK